MVEALQTYYPKLKLLTAANGAEGLQLFREARPQLVLTDIRMPLMDGIQMAAGIKAIDPEVYIIGLTAYNDRSFLSTAADAGFSECILKPVDYGTLFASINKFFCGDSH
jgi:YesN/AraC family two-component response regulator